MSNAIEAGTLRQISPTEESSAIPRVVKRLQESISDIETIDELQERNEHLDPAHLMKTLLKKHNEGNYYKKVLGENMDNWDFPGMVDVGLKDRLNSLVKMWGTPEVDELEHITDELKNRGESDPDLTMRLVKDFSQRTASLLSTAA